jgi:hypothetical protein
MTMRTIRAGNYVFTVKAAMLFEGGYVTKIMETNLASPEGGTETDHSRPERWHASAEDALRHGELLVKGYPLVSRSALIPSISNVCVPNGSRFPAIAAVGMYSAFG